VSLIETPIKKIVLHLSRTRFVQSAVVDPVDLRAFRRRPDLRIISGVSAIALSYVIGWPLISVLGIAAVHYGNAAIVAVGGPVAYGLSHLVFLLGMYLAGAKYSRIFMRWAVSRGMTRLLQRYRLPLPSAPSPADVGMVAGHDEQGGCHCAQAAANARPVDQRRADGQAQDHGQG
jgi:hypothetical protein